MSQNMQKLAFFNEHVHIDNTRVEITAVHHCGGETFQSIFSLIIFSSIKTNYRKNWHDFPNSIFDENISFFGE